MGTMIDGSSGTFWHVKYPRDEVIVFVDVNKDRKRPIKEWRVPFDFVDIDMERERQVRAIRILPREGSNDQMWAGLAFWLGNKDEHKWNIIAWLDVDRKVLKGDRWINFILPEDRAFRYYRLKILDRHFLSFAEIELFE